LIRVQHAQALPDNMWRPVAIGAVLLIHLLIAAVLLSGMPKTAGQRAALREIFFVFAPKPNPREKLPPVPPTSARPVRISNPRDRIYSPKTNINPNSQIKGLGLSLLECVPQNLANLSPEERKQCSSSISKEGPRAPKDANLASVRERAVYAGTWSASIARRNRPLAVPCASMKEIPEDITIGRTAKVIMVDPLCALGLTKGSKQ